jgi:hypothetical protein
MKQLQVITLILIQMVAGAQAQNVDQAKKLFQAKQDSVIWVTGVATLSFTASDSRDAGMTPPDEEVKVESLATLVDASGVAVAVLSQLDPARNMNNRPLRTSRGPMKLETTATLKDLKLVLADGSEILADIVLKDEDLDLAFVRARAEGGNTNGVVFPALNLKDSVTANVLDEAISITRLDETFNRAPNVFASHINMATRKPRVFYRAIGATGGCPTFSAEGKLIGITSARLIKGKQAAAAIVPATEILEGLEQIKSNKQSSGAGSTNASTKP